MEFLDPLFLIFQIRRKPRWAQLGCQTLQSGCFERAGGRRSHRLDFSLSARDSIFQDERPQLQALIGALGGTQFVTQTDEPFDLDGLPGFQSIQDVSCRLFSQAIRIDVLISGSQDTQRAISVDPLFEGSIPLVAGTRQDLPTIRRFQKDIKEVTLTNFGGIPFHFARLPVLRIAEFGNIHDVGRLLDDLQPFGFG